MVWGRASPSIRRLGRVTLDQRPLQPYAQTADAGHFSGVAAAAPAAVDGPLYLAGCPESDGSVGRHFDGKIDGPMLLAGIHPAEGHQALLRDPPDATWRTRSSPAGISPRRFPTTRAVDIGRGGHHGRLVHLPARGMKGWNWTGEEHSWTRKPEHYGAIHFHSDDLYDAGWETSVALTIPEDLSSGPYALHVSCGESDETATREDYLAFFVRPPRGARPAQEPPAGPLAGADLLLHGLCQSCRAHHRPAAPSGRWGGC